MKIILALCVLSIVALVNAKPSGCRFGPWGRCVEQCPDGTHSYSSGCRPLVPEATCDNPNPVAGQAPLCDYSACYCDAPTVRDSTTGRCVQLEECPKKEE
ncbi:hypothetical protein PYW08_008901 [Mythimna loreyi]|uniref:Uncharacterized protein n=1 Tax=Mythimna loreyi TaxID=667449 RepID=A0ACC2Q9X5_9NEOP|nr:hypothetical protein PYW08_008901 [Mythimna loreyi]